MDGNGRRRARAVALAGTALATLGAAALVAGPAGADTLTPTSTKVALVLRGNGHGHGMSQYGARGAAIAGLSYKQILAFYYPGTSVTTLPHTLIRVKLSNAGTNLQVLPARDLVVTGVAKALPTAGVARYRLLSNSASGTRLQVLGTAAGSKWHTVYNSLPNRAQFHRTSWANLRVFSPDGTTTDYSGYLRAVRVRATGTTGGIYAVNIPNLDNYTAGVVPREMPVSWQPAAVNAQAVAARTYADYAIAHPQNREWDICDTTACQVYGGVYQHDRAGRLLTSYAPGPAKATAGQVLTYRGSAAFTQFSASNGGWTVAGGQPYLVAKQDPYDDAASGDPYLSYTRTVALSPVASRYKLSKITKVEITVRDGKGPLGGRAIAGYVTGTTSNGTITRVPTTGSQLAGALGVGTTWLQLRNP